MQLTCTAWVESLNTRDDVKGNTYRSCQKHESLSLHDHLLWVSFITSLEPNSCTALTIQNTKESNCVISHTQNATALEYIGYRSQTRGGGFSRRKPLSKSIAKSSHYLYLCMYIMIYTPHQKYLGDQIRENEIGCAWRTYGGEEKFIYGFGGEIWRT
jgi:hypothetical protein